MRFSTSLPAPLEGAEYLFPPTAPSLSTALEASSAAYAQRFASLFPGISSFTESQQAFARAITANLVGGIGYWDGPSIVDRTFSQEWDNEELKDNVRKPELTEPRELYSATPSRSFFPRGFYWDEGFHLSLIGAWDNDLSLEIFKSWLNLADEDGWIGREQILGDEARSRVRNFARLSLTGRTLTAVCAGPGRVPSSIPLLRQSSNAHHGLDRLHLPPPRRRYLPLLPRHPSLHRSH